MGDLAESNIGGPESCAVAGGFRQWVKLSRG